MYYEYRYGYTGMPFSVARVAAIDDERASSLEQRGSVHDCIAVVVASTSAPSSAIQYRYAKFIRLQPLTMTSFQVRSLVLSKQIYIVNELVFDDFGGARSHWLEAAIGVLVLYCLETYCIHCLS
jgi:hypothetical protein